MAVSGQRAAGAEDVGLTWFWWGSTARISWGRGRGRQGVMWEEDGWREAISYLEHSERSLSHKAVGPLRLLVLIRVGLLLRDFTLLSSPGFIWLPPSLGDILHLLGLSPADMICLPGALEGLQELLQAHISLHELLQQLLLRREHKQTTRHGKVFRGRSDRRDRPNNSRIKRISSVYT